MKDERNGMCAGIIHVVQKGDTLYRLAGQYHVSVSDIMYKNPYANVYNLQAGDEICIPVSGKSMIYNGRNSEQLIL